LKRARVISHGNAGYQERLNAKFMSSVDVINARIDVGTLVDSLIEVDRAPVKTMQKQVTALQSKATAYQTFNTKLSALSDKINSMLYADGQPPLLTPYSYEDRLSESVFAKCKVNSSDENAISATAASANTQGSYSITVSGLAQAKTMASIGFADTTATATGTGTLTIKTGSNDPVTVTINSSNCTLNGVCNAINNANAGVTATIINDGSSTPYRLLLSADETGTANAFTFTDNLTGGQALSMAQTQAATDAQFLVNGVSMTKSSNVIDDVLSGITFTLKEQSADPVTLRVDKDVDSIVTALKDLVSSYNAVNAFISSQFTYNKSSESAGVLAGDSTLRSVQSTLQNQIVQSIKNQFTTLGVTGQVGLDFSRTGEMSLDETKLRKSLSENFTAVAALFLGNGTDRGSASATDRRVSYSSKTSATQAGTYAVDISALAEQATAVGNQAVNALTSDETLTISYGSANAAIILLQDDTLSTVLGKINSAFTAQGMAVTASDDGTGRIKIATNNYGSAETITIVSDRYDAEGSTGFGLTPIVANGTDIAGTIGGNAATGSGLTLMGVSGLPQEGLTLSISQTTTGSYGSVTVASETRGVEGQSILYNLFNALDGITDPLSGPITNAKSGLTNNIRSINDQISEYEARLEVRRTMLTTQFSQADEALRLMSITQASLSSQLSGLS
jgi:flagellar hook-associated protein 2